MSTLTEIEAAVETLPQEQQQELMRYLERRLIKQTKGSRTLPVVPVSGRPITQQEIGDALEAECSDPGR